jgi:hypothetical protein
MTDDSAIDVPAQAEVIEPPVENEGSVIHASKLMRIASMTRALLEEARHAPIDEAGRRRLTEVHYRTIEEMDEVLTPDLRQELEDMFPPLEGEGASESEIRISQAQLVGWLEGLFAGIQASLFSQQAMAAGQLQQMRMRALEMQARDSATVDEAAPGQYL